MTFTKEAIIAILKLGFTIAEADGKKTDKQIDIIWEVVERFHWAMGEMSLSIIDDIAALNTPETVKRIAFLTTEQKKYIVAYLTKIMVSGASTPYEARSFMNELSMWASLPRMSEREALDYYNSI